MPSPQGSRNTTVAVPRRSREMEGHLGMPDNRRAPLLAYVLAVPVLIAVYAGAFGTRVWAALRPAVATFLGATVIGTVYADAALKRAPATPMRAAAALALAVALVGPGMAPAPALAGGDAAEKVIAAAREHLGKNYKLGAEGPKEFDCSGLVYRAFADAGELPRIGGMRLLARGYLRWFTSRGLFTKDEDKADPGDLVVWNNGEHIGIYIGNGRAISALINPYGVMIHSLHGIHQKVTQFLKVDWRGDDPGDGPGDPPPGDGPGDPPPGDGPGDPPPSDDPGDGGPGDGGDNPGNGPGNGGDPGPGEGDDPTPPPDDPGDGTDPGNGTNPGDSGAGPDEAVVGDNTGAGDQPTGPRANAYGPPAGDEVTRPEPANGGDQQPSGNGTQQAGNSRIGYATGTMNMRLAADPEARIVGWVSRGARFKILSKGTSPSGYLWYEVETTSGRQGWLFGYWVREG